MAVTAKARIGKSIVYFHPTNDNPEGTYQVVGLSHFYWATSDVNKTIPTQTLEMRQTNALADGGYVPFEWIEIRDLRDALDYLNALPEPESDLEKFLVNKFKSGITNCLAEIEANIISSVHTLMLENGRLAERLKATEGIATLYKERNQLHKTGLILFAAMTLCFLTFLPWRALLYVELAVATLIFINRTTGYVKEEKERAEPEVA